jgi:hypothetical protein
MKRPSIPPVLRGSFICLRRKCGKPHCRCLQGKPHASPALSYSQHGKTKILILPKPIVPQVRAALRRYLQSQTRLQHQADTGLGQLAQQLRQIRTSNR